MPALNLTPDQRARVRAGRCACGCGRPTERGRGYADDSAACRKRAQRQRQAWEASGEPERLRLQARLDATTAELGRLTAELDRLTRRRQELRELATDLQTRLSGQLELPVVTPAPSSPAGVTPALERLHPADVVWQALTLRAELRLKDEGWRLERQGKAVGVLPSRELEALARARLLERQGAEVVCAGPEARVIGADMAAIRRRVRKALADG